MNAGDARLFISYSHRGNGPKWKATLLDSLHVFEQHHLLDVWQDGKIRVSSFWDDDIKQAMTNAQLAVVLLTKEALESEYIIATEFPFLRERQQRDKLAVFPVVCEECDWRAHDWLRATQSPNESNPISVLTEEAQARNFRQLATDIAEELSRVALAELPKPEQPIAHDHIYLDRFPLTHGSGLQIERLIGREQEIALLDLAFAQPQTAIVSLVAWGGVGKTMLVQHWLKRLERLSWFGVRNVYAWSFYSQGTKENRQSSEDNFLAHALKWFDVRYEPALSPWDKGRLLADAIAREGTLLILDGIEPLQYPPGPMGGKLRAPGIQSLLTQLARKPNETEHHGLCLVTTREPLTDLTDFERRRNAAWGSVLRVDVANLNEEAGAALLHDAGAKRVGAAEISSDDAELFVAVREVDGHALTLNLLGRFLARAHGGDIRRRDLVKFEEADRTEQGGTTFKMLAAFEKWFSNSGEFEMRSLAILQILGLFDHPADPGCITTLREPPVIAGLTDSLFTTRIEGTNGQATVQPFPDEVWNSAVSYLADFGLLIIDANNNSRECSLDCHPLIREHFAKRLRDNDLESWLSAHERIYKHLKDSSESFPSTLEGLEPLYRAVVHGCRARLSQLVHDEVYFPRILRGNEHFTWHQHAAFGAELAALACFFDKPWSRPSPLVSMSTQAWLLNEVAFCLRALGRLTEALEPMRISLKMAEEQGRWADAAIGAGNLSELELTLGEIAAAVQYGELSVDYSNRIGHAFYMRRNRTVLADALHAAGRRNEALALFEQAEDMQRKVEPFPLLYSLLGSRYCDLLLATPERATWQRSLGMFFKTEEPIPSQICDQVGQRARKMFEWRQPEDSLIEIAFDHLTLGRATLYASVLGSTSTDARTSSIKDLQAAVERFRSASQQEFLALGLLVRSWLHFLEGNLTATRADLDDAWQIAERGAMRLCMADVHLHRARHFHDKDSLRKARVIIQECGYLRRKEELEDAEEAATTWPDTPNENALAFVTDTDQDHSQRGGFFMDADLHAEVEFGDGRWFAARARHLDANSYAVIVPFSTPLPTARSEGPPLIGIRIEGKHATYVHSKKLRVTPQGELILLALTDPK